jgi:hypothetical protein
MYNFYPYHQGFSYASGLKLNLGKSQLLGVGKSQQEVEDMASLFGCKAAMFPFSYLGVSIGANINLEKNWKPVYHLIVGLPLGKLEPFQWEEDSLWLTQFQRPSCCTFFPFIMPRIR